MRLATTIGFVAALASFHGHAAVQFVQPPTLTPNENASAPLVARLHVEVQPAATLTVVIEGSAGRLRPVTLNQATLFDVPLLGFVAGESHQVHVTAVAGDDSVSTTFDYLAPSLPHAPEDFPQIVAPIVNQERMEPGFRLFNPRRQLPRQTAMGDKAEREFGQSFGLLVMVNAHGRPIWYYRTDSRISDFNILEDGDQGPGILYLTQDHRIVHIDWLGNEISSWYASPTAQDGHSGVHVEALGFHHDVNRIDETTIAALTPVRREFDSYDVESLSGLPGGPVGVMGDEVVVFDRAGSVQWRWNAFDHLDPLRIGYETDLAYWGRRGFANTIDWSHANAIVLDPRDRSLLINFRYQSALIKVDRAEGKIVWIFGEPSGWPHHLTDRLIALQDSDRWFWHQHSPVLTQRGTLLMFDNGNYQARPPDPPTPIAQTWSRAVEYQIDEIHRTARQVWSSEIPGDEKVVAVAMGSVSELPVTGNILVGDGALLDSRGLDEVTWDTRFRLRQWTRAREYTHTTPPEVLWEIRLTAREAATTGWTIFGVRAVSEHIFNDVANRSASPGTGENRFQ
ncbi:MAG: aryl-sulfate sulfotransferase [Pseudomonadales bacterium]